MAVEAELIHGTNTAMKGMRADTEMRDRDRRAHESTDVGVLYCAHLWLLSLTKALSIATPVLFVLWIYLLPSLLLRTDLVESMRDVWYVKFRKVLTWFSFVGYSSAYLMLAVEFHFVRLVSVAYLSPGMCVGLILDVFLSIPLLSNLFSLFLTISAIGFLQQMKLAPNSPQILVEIFRKKTAVTKSMFWMTLVIFTLFFIFTNLHPIYLEVGLLGKIGIRFVAVPILTSMAIYTQKRHIQSVNRDYAEDLFPMIWITQGFLKAYERIFTNEMTTSGDYASFAATTLATAVLEIINHASYLQRDTLIGKLINKAKSFLAKKPSHVRSVSVIPKDGEDIVDLNKSKEHLNEQAWISAIRKKLILEDISIELMMIFTVTFLLYLMHALVENDSIETIAEINVCIVQLMIQIACEFLSDVAGLYLTIKRHRIRLDTSDVTIKNKWYWVWFFYILWQSIWILWAFISF